MAENISKPDHEIQIWLVVSTHLNNIIKLEIFPNFRGEKKKHIWNHHLEMEL